MEWKPVVGFESLYQVSDMGDVANIRGEPLKARITNRGYAVVLLSRRGERKKSFQVHRLVMAAFSGPSAQEVNHLNGIKHDNRRENLAYSTRSDNMKHAYATGLSSQPRGQDSRVAKLTDDAVRVIRRRLRMGYRPLLLAEQFGVSDQTIYRIRRGKAWAHVPDESAA